MPVNTDRTITANRPDIIVKDSINSTCKLIDMTVPSDRNITLKEVEKKSTYKNLELEIQSENVAYENHSDPCGCWCAWYSTLLDILGHSYAQNLLTIKEIRLVYLFL